MWIHSAKVENVLLNHNNVNILNYRRKKSGHKKETNKLFILIHDAFSFLWAFFSWFGGIFCAQSHSFSSFADFFEICWFSWYFWNLFSSIFVFRCICSVLQCFWWGYKKAPGKPKKSTEFRKMFLKMGNW